MSQNSTMDKFTENLQPDQYVMKRCTILTDYLVGTNPSSNIYQDKMPKGSPFDNENNDTGGIFVHSTCSLLPHHQH